jgi:hypothetical protein
MTVPGVRSAGRLEDRVGREIAASSLLFAKTLIIYCHREPTLRLVTP